MGQCDEKDCFGSSTCGGGGADHRMKPPPCGVHCTAFSRPGGSERVSDLPRRIESEIPALRRYAWALVHDPDRADDLVQDCLERALSRLRLWRREGDLRAWLFTILHNIHANQVRARSRRPRTLPLEQAGDAGTVLDDPQARITLEQTLEALWKLPGEQREVLLLVVVEGLAYREVAAVLGTPIGTVMSRLARARERLRALTEGSQPRHLRRVK